MPWMQVPIDTVSFTAKNDINDHLGQGMALNLI